MCTKMFIPFFLIHCLDEAFQWMWRLHQSVYTMQLWQLKPNYGVNTEDYGPWFLAFGHIYFGKNYLCAHQGSNLAPSKAIDRGLTEILTFGRQIFFTWWIESYFNILVTSTKLFNFLCWIKNMDLIEHTLYTISLAGLHVLWPTSRFSGSEDWNV